MTPEPLPSLVGRVVTPSRWWLFFIAWAAAALMLGLLLISPRLVASADLRSPTSFDKWVAPSDRAYLKAETRAVVTPSMTDEQKVLALLAWVMNRVPRVEGYTAATSAEMLEAVQHGRGLTCGELAQIFHDALITNGIPARRVSLWRNFGDPYDTHVTVEAYVNGEWRVYDPTFHLTLISNGERVGALRAREWFIKGRGAPVKFQFLGPVSYPARVDNYPTPLPPLFDNTSIELRRTIPSLTWLPRIGRFAGREYAYPENDPGFDHYVEHNVEVLRSGLLEGLLVCNALFTVVFGALVIRRWRYGRLAPVLQ